MKTKLYAFAIFITTLSLQLHAQVKHIRWGTNTNPLKDLVITWRNTGTTDSIKWGYTTALEKGSAIGVRRTGYSGNFFNYAFATVNPSSSIYYKIYDSGTKTWGAQKQFRTAPDESKKEFSFAGIG